MIRVGRTGIFFWGGGQLCWGVRIDSFQRKEPHKSPSFRLGYYWLGNEGLSVIAIAATYRSGRSSRRASGIKVAGLFSQ